MKTRYNGHNSDINTKNEMVKGTTLSAYVRSLKRDNIPHNITWIIVKRAAPYNPITKICRLCISEKAHILFHPEDSVLNQRSEFFSKCWHKETHFHHHHYHYHSPRWPPSACGCPRWRDCNGCTGQCS